MHPRLLQKPIQGNIFVSSSHCARNNFFFAGWQIHWLYTLSIVLTSVYKRNLVHLNSPVQYWGSAVSRVQIYTTERIAHMFNHCRGYSKWQRRLDDILQQIAPAAKKGHGATIFLINNLMVARTLFDRIWLGQISYAKESSLTPFVCRSNVHPKPCILLVKILKYLNFLPTKCVSPWMR